MTSVILDIPIEALPDLMTRAAHSLPHVNLIEVLPDGALVATRTTLALRADTTRFAFHSKPDGRTEVEAVSTIWPGVSAGRTKDLSERPDRQSSKPSSA